jgi:hypothetical protein
MLLMTSNRIFQTLQLISICPDRFNLTPVPLKRPIELFTRYYSRIYEHILA